MPEKRASLCGCEEDLELKIKRINRGTDKLARNNYKSKWTKQALKSSLCSRSSQP